MDYSKKNLIIITLALLLVFAGAFLFWRSRDNGKKEIINARKDVENDETVGSDKNVEGGKNVGSVGNVENNEESLPNNTKVVENETDTPSKESFASSSGNIDISDKLVSWGFEKSIGRKIDTVIIHATYNALGGDKFSLSKILDIYKSYGVSPHYIIDRSGSVYRLVEDKDIAYHAGDSKMPDGRTGVNNFSIGVEMINDKESSCTAEQYKSLKNLIGNLKEKYKIKYTLGHDDIAPGRKDDPWNFDWGKIK